MTIFVTKGDLLKEETDAIINTVNCVGVMGKGIALQFKQKWPSNFKAYEKACKAKEVQIGKMFVHELGKLGGKPYYIINFPTKDHWRGKSELSFIDEGLKDLIEQIKQYQIKSIAIPPLGCGNGGLKWDIVRQLIEKHFYNLNNQIEVHLFEPGGAPDAKAMVTRTDKPAMTVGRAILIKLLSIYREMEYSLSKIEIQKLCYLAQEAGEPLKLNFAKHQFGPYADNLRHVLNNINGHYITGVGDHDTSESHISLVPEAIREADAFLVKHEDSLVRLEKVAKLIEGFETPYGMELLATVHWAATRDIKNVSANNVVEAVYNWEPSQPIWNKRKQSLMQENHIKIALGRLQQEGWV